MATIQRELRPMLKGTHNSLRIWQHKANDPSAASNGQLENAQNETALVSFLRSYAHQKDLYRGRQIHAYVLKKGLLETNIHIGNTLVSMYAQWGALVRAREIFDELCDQDVVAWTALIAGYARHGYSEEVLKCFEAMQCKGLAPVCQTFACILKACGSIGEVKRGEEVHCEIVRRGLLAKHVELGSALVDMYVKCGSFAKAREVLDVLPFRNKAFWNRGFATQ